jgi:hypothetical protein
MQLESQGGGLENKTEQYLTTSWVTFPKTPDTTEIRKFANST